jgi:hypothetical protein
MLHFTPSAFSRLDFWGGVIDLAGLTVLLSYDVRFLNPVLSIVTQVRHIQRIKKLTTTLLQKINSFYRTMNGPMMPERLDTLVAPDAAIFLKVFPNWKSGPVPASGIGVFIVNLGVGVNNLPSIYAANAKEDPDPQQKPLAGPVPVEFVLTQLEKQTQNFVYGAGFALMALGSILSLIQIAGGG